MLRDLDERYAVSWLFLVRRSFLCFFFFCHLIQPRRALVARLGYSFTRSPFRIHCHHIAQTSNKRSSGYLPTRSFPPTLQLIQPRRVTSTRLGYSFHLNPSPQPLLHPQSAQTSACHSSGLSFHRIPSFVSPTISYSPDKRLSLIWAVFSLDLSSLSHLQSHLTQTSCKRSSGCIFNTAFFLRGSTSLSTSSSPDEHQALVWAILFTSTHHLHLCYNLNQPR